MTTTIGERLVQIRGHKSQAAFAEDIGVSKGSVGNYERGERTPDADFLAALMRMGYSANWVLTGEGPMLLSDAQETHPAATSTAPVIDRKALVFALEAVEGVIKGLPTKTWGYAEKAELIAAVYLVALEAGGDTKAIAEVFNGIAKAYGRGAA